MVDSAATGIYEETILAQIMGCIVDIVPDDVGELEYFKVQIKIKRIIVKELNLARRNNE